MNTPEIVGSGYLLMKYPADASHQPLHGSNYPISSDSEAGDLGWDAQGRTQLIRQGDST